MRIRNEDNMLDEKIIKELQEFAEKIEYYDDRFTVEFCEIENRTYPDFTVIINNVSYQDQSLSSNTQVKLKERCILLFIFMSLIMVFNKTLAVITMLQKQ